MEIQQHDLSLETALEQVTLHPDRVGIIPLPGVESEIRLRAAETPGTYLVTVWSTGAEPFQKTEAVVVNALQFAVIFRPLMEKSRSRLERMSRRLTQETERFLQGQS